MSHLLPQLRGVLGIIGFPVSHSLSPHMHNWAARHFGLDLVYVHFEVKPQDFEAAIQGVKALGLRGVNITVPYKERILPFLDERDSEVDELQAVNTVVLKDNKLIGFNTDGKGFVNSLREETGITLSGRKCLLLGAGGAARAIGVYLALSGVKNLYIANRDQLKAERLATDIRRRYPEVIVQILALAEDSIAAYLPGVEIIINATSLGIGGYGMPPLPFNLLSKDHVVCDIVYNPVDTSLLQSARKKGARTVTGLGMLAHQGVLAFEIWTGLLPPVSEYRKILAHFLNKA